VVGGIAVHVATVRTFTEVPGALAGAVDDVTTCFFAGAQQCQFAQEGLLASTRVRRQFGRIGRAPKPRWQVRMAGLGAAPTAALASLLGRARPSISLRRGCPRAATR